MSKKSSRKLGLLMGLGLSTCLLMGAGAPKQVTLEDDGRVWTVLTGANTVEQLVKEQNIQFDQGEVSFPAGQNALVPNMKVAIKEGYQIEINDKGQKATYSVSQKKVSEILQELSIVLGPNDTVYPDLGSSLEAEQVLTITRTVDQVSDEKVEIPFTSNEVANPDMFQGERKVIQAGQKGIINKKVLNRYVNGQVRLTLVLSSQKEREMVPEIVQVGTKAPQNMINGKKYVKKIRMKGSAYDPSAGSRTAMGTRARVRAVAVDPRVIPLGTKLYIESTDGFPTYGYAVAEDTGGAIKGNRIDLFYNTNREANRFGRRDVMVYILEDGQ